MAGPQRVTIDSDLVIDCTPEQDYQGDVETTDSPIEQGADVTDHAREKPETFVATCIVSSVPVDPNDRKDRGPFKPWTTGGYARTTFEKLVAMKSERKTHTITTPLRTYRNMILVGLGSPTRADLGDGVSFKMSWKSIRIVNSGTATFLAQPKVTGTQKPTEKENQAKKQGDKKDRTTALKSLTNALGLTKAGSGVAPP